MKKKNNFEHWFDLELIIEECYLEHGITDRFEQDIVYLETAYKRIEKIWLAEFKKVKEIKTLIISEAPLWGERENYFYNYQNPESPYTPFITKPALRLAFKDMLDKKDKEITKKTAVERLRKEGVLILDIMPFPLNKNVTKLSWTDLSKKKYKEYNELFLETAPYHLIPKLKLIASRTSALKSIGFRIARGKNAALNTLNYELNRLSLTKKKTKKIDLWMAHGNLNKNQFQKLFQ